MKQKFTYITEEYCSNCLLEAIKAKLKNKDIKIYYCKPRITGNRNFQMLHFMWTDGKADYDFSDNEEDELPWYRCFLFRGRIRKFKRGFAELYSKWRNGKQLEAAGHL